MFVYDEKRGEGSGGRSFIHRPFSFSRHCVYETNRIVRGPVWPFETGPIAVPCAAVVACLLACLPATRSNALQVEKRIGRPIHASGERNHPFPQFPPLLPILLSFLFLTTIVFVNRHGCFFSFFFFLSHT